MRWLTWMATFAFLTCSGCGGAEGDAPAPAPAGRATTAAPEGGANTAPANTSEAPGGVGTTSPQVKDAVSPAQTSRSDATRGAPDVSPSPPTLEPEPADAGPVEMPEVNLGQGPYAQSTLLKVGDTIPEIALTNLDGEPTTVAAPGENELLVLVFWDSNSAVSALELRWLERALAARDGVRVVAINRGEPAETVRAVVEKESLTYPVLLDTDGALFAHFATQTVPRTYLVGAGGEILWLEVTFQGLTTIKTLEQAIAAAQAE